MKLEEAANQARLAAATRILDALLPPPGSQGAPPAVSAAPGGHRAGGADGVTETDEPPAVVTPGALDNLCKLLGRMLQDPHNATIRRMRRDVLERVFGGAPALAALRPLLDFAGFREEGGGEAPRVLVAPAAGAEGAAPQPGPQAQDDPMRAVVDAWEQRKVLAMDPGGFTFAEVMDCVQKDQKLPGIAGVDDRPTTPVPETETGRRERPRKPWEQE